MAAVPDGTRALIALARRPYYGWVLVWALGITTIIAYGSTQYLYGLLVVPLSLAYGWSRAEISGAYSLGVLLTGIFGIAGGRIVDRYGARAVMAGGAALAGVCLLALSRVDALWQLYGIWSLGIGLACALTYYPISYVVVTNWFEARRGDAMATLTLFGAFASPVFIPLSGALIATIGWRATAVVLGAVQLLVAAPLCAVFLRRRPEDIGLFPDGDARRVRSAEADSGMRTREALRTSAFWLLTAAACLFTFAGTVIFVHQVPYMIAHHYPPVLAATLAGASGIAYIPGRYLAKRLSGTFDPHAQLAASLVLQALGLVVFIEERSIAWIVVYLLIYGGAFGTFAPLRGTLMADHFGRRAYGAIVAAQGLPMALCAAAGPLCAGRLYDLLGNYGAAFGICTASLLASAACVSLAGRRT